jgi:pimeloyl-ACP methyl ester carboxylesterase
MRSISLKIFLVSMLFFALSVLLVACQGTGKTVQEFDVLASDVRLHVRMAGNPHSGCVLVAINGGPGLTSNYMLDLEEVAGPDCAVVTYDQRGMGASSQPANPGSSQSYSILKYAQDVEAIRLEIGAEHLHLFGHSFGGIVAMQYAILYPENVESLIFFGSGPPTWKDIEVSQENFSARLMELIGAGIIPPPEQWEGGEVDPLLPAYFSDPTFTFSEDSLGGPPEFNQVVSDLTAPNLKNLDLRNELTSLLQPVLLMFGRDDPFGLQMAEATREALVNAPMEFVIIDHCGHFWHECPDEFYPRLLEFLKKK